MKQKTIYTTETLKARCIEEGQCWIWQGYFGNGTPMANHAGKFQAVRRIFTELTQGETKKGGYYAPTCGEPKCVNPDHTAWHNPASHYRRMGVVAMASESAQQVRRAKISASKRRISDDAITDIMHSNDNAKIVAARHGISPSTVSKYRRGVSGVTLQCNPWAALMPTNDNKSRKAA